MKKSFQSPFFTTARCAKIIEELALQADDFPEFTIHCCPNEDVDLEYFEGEFKRAYERVIPSSKSVTCVVWQVEDEVERGAHPFHNRYVLTNFCGLMVGYGTDSAKEVTDAKDTLQFLAEGVSRDLLRHSQKRTHPMLAVRKKIITIGV